MQMTPTLTVTALNERIRGMLLPMRDLRVEGEVSGARFSSGHLYFDLKDATAKVRVTVWKSTVERLTTNVRDGQQVVVTGKVDLWVQAGTYALNAADVQPAGLGARFAALQALKEKLTAEGLFDDSRKKPLPYLPRVVGLVTSPTGAALHDILRVLNSRYPLRVILAPCKVQGDGSAESIAQAIDLLDQTRLCDVIIAGRGGGSLEDLWAFNEERVVRAFARCQTPIVSAVGHEVDTLLSDLAADLRAATPSVAAEKVVPRLVDLQFQLGEAQKRMQKVVQRLLKHERAILAQRVARLGQGDQFTGPLVLRLDELTRRLQSATQKQVAVRHRQLALSRQKLSQAHPMRRLATQQRALDALQARMKRVEESLVRVRRDRLAHQTAVLRAMSPKAALGRGYGIVRRVGTAEALQSVRGMVTGVQVEVLLGDGALDCVVEKVRVDG